MRKNDLAYESEGMVLKLKTLIEDGLPRYQEMEDLICKLMFVEMEAMGCFLNEPVETHSFIVHSGLKENYQKWAQESIEILFRNKYLVKTEGVYQLNSSLEPISRDKSWSEWEAKKLSWKDNAGMTTQAVLVEETLKALILILKGEIKATEVMFPNSSMRLVEGIYKNNQTADFFNEVLSESLVVYINNRLKENAGTKIKIFEIGAGTGGTTALVLNRIKEYKEHIQEYCYTDLSKAFLMHGEREYGKENPFLTYKIFNVEEPLAGQDVVPGQYDVIIATNVLHATKNIRNTIQNTKALLKKNGVILLNEIAEKSIFTHLTFGLLDGWWLYEDRMLRIPGNPGISSKTWEQIMDWEGFFSVNFPAEAGHKLGQQVITAYSNGIVRQKQVAPAVKVVSKEQKPQTNIQVKPKIIKQKTVIKQKRSNSGSDVTEQMMYDHVRMVIRDSIAAELKISDDKIQDLKSLSDYGVDSIVAVNLINSINKALSITLKTTALFDYNNVKILTDFVVKENKQTLAGLLSENTGGGEIEEEIIEEIIEENSVDANYEPEDNNTSRVVHIETIQSANQSYNENTYYRVMIEKPGSIADLKIVQDNARNLREDEVRIAVKAFSLNFGDLLCLQGLYPTMPPYPFTPGFEVSGVVVETGRLVKRFKTGDEVFAMMGKELGGHSTMVVSQESEVFKKSDSLSFEESCSLPAVAVTMIAAFHKANLKKGEKILIQTATGGTGLIAIQLAKYYGAEIYATAGYSHKLDYLEKLGVPYRINYRENDFEKEIKKLTNGRGVDVVINTLSGDAIQKGINCLAPGGRYIEIAMTAIKSARNIDLSALSSNQTFYSIDLRKLSQQSGQEAAQYNLEMIDLANKGVIKPTIYKIVPFDRIQDAYTYLSSRDNIGKVVVQISGEYQYQQKLVAGASQQVQQRDIAIIGMSGRFARSDSTEEFWKHLSHGDDLVEKITRWDFSSFYCNTGSYLEHIDLFDPLFFNISGLEATCMDPQQRIILEESWKAIEDAGYSGSSIGGTPFGVYIGCANGDYQHLFKGDMPSHVFWGNSGAMIPARISYFLNLQGPAVAIDTACSSSLLAIHMACEALWNKEISTALAGGIFIQSTPNFYTLCVKSEMLAPSGLCRTFDDSADGFVPGEGAGVIVLKRLEDAITDKDHIYGVIKGSGVNQDGTTNGILAPSMSSQERLEKQVYDTFNINPAHIQMVEAHGTATKLGDPIELEALIRSFSHYTDNKGFCAVGSVKTNIGHTAAAAGIAGVIKVLLSLKYKKIPPSLNFKKVNSQVNLDDSPFYVNTSLKDWDVPPDTKRTAAISSFAWSGTNAHLIIEEAPPVEKVSHETPGYLIVLSARTSEQLQMQAQRLVQHVEAVDDLDCGDMSYTLLTGRKHLKHRLVCVIRNKAELVKLLTRWLEKKSVPQITISELKDASTSEKASLKSYGNDIIHELHNNISGGEYLDKLSAIGELFSQGYILEYDTLFESGKYYRVSLPVYPFAREKYWVETDNIKIVPEVKKIPEKVVPVTIQKAVVAPKEAEIKVVEKDQADDLMFIPRFEEQTGGKKDVVRQVNSLLIVCTESSEMLADKLAEYFNKQEKPGNITSIKMGPKTRNVSENKWICAEDDPEGFGKCLQGQKHFEKVFYLSEFNVSFNSDLMVEERQEMNALQLLRLIKLLKQKEFVNNKMDVYLIAQDNYRVSDYSVNPLGGAVTGLAYSIAQSDYRFAVRNIDISSEDLKTEDGQKQTVELILQQPAFNRGDIIKLYQGKIYRQNYYRMRLDENYTGEGIRKRGVYVIIGGSGSVGEVISRFMAKNYKAKLIWIGRRKGDSEEIKKKLEGFKDFGQKPLYIQADAKDLTQMTHALALIKERYALINGVIFAGLVFKADNSIVNTNEEDFLDVFAVKNKGSYNVYQTFKEEALDFICYYSSAQAFAFSGAANFSAYAAGITAADIYTQSIYAEAKYPIGMINWGFWNWENNSDTVQAAKNIQFMDHEQGFECFEKFIRLLRNKVLNQLICFKTNDVVKDLMRLNNEVLTVNNGTLVKIQAGPIKETKSNFVPETNKKGLQAQKISDNNLHIEAAKNQKPAAAKTNPEYLAAHVKNVLLNQFALSVKLAESIIQTNVAFSEYGMDSIMGVAFVKKVNDELSLELNSAILFDYSTLDQLSDYIVKTYGDQISLEENQTDEVPAQPAVLENTVEVPSRKIPQAHPVYHEAVDITGQIKQAVLTQFALSVKLAESIIQTNVAFSEYGMDSIMGVAFVKKVNDELSLELNSAILFDYSTIDQLTEFIVKTYNEELMLRFAEGSVQQQQEAPEMNSPNSGDIENLEHLFFEGQESIDSILEKLK